MIFGGFQERLIKYLGGFRDDSGASQEFLKGGKGYKGCFFGISGSFQERLNMMISRVVLCGYGGFRGDLKRFKTGLYQGCYRNTLKVKGFQGK